MLKVFPFHFPFIGFVSPPPHYCFTFVVLIAVYRQRVITCETGRVIFFPRVWILSRPIASAIAPSLRWLNPNGWMTESGAVSGEREREGGWQWGLTRALNHAPRNPPSTGPWQPHCHHGQGTSYASWQHWSRISQSIRCKLVLFKDDNEHQDTCRCHWRDAIMIGCPSHRAPLGLMVFRPGMGWRREPGGRGRGRDGQGESFPLWSVSICACWTLWPDRKTLTRCPGSRRTQLSTHWHAVLSHASVVSFVKPAQTSSILNTLWIHKSRAACSSCIL